MATKKSPAMKKKSSAKRSRSAKKMEPAARYLRYELTNSGSSNTETSHYIDLARDLSRVNRRLYRQGRDYHVKKITIVSSNTPNVGYTDPTTLISGARVSVSTIPYTWVSQMAWKRAFDSWNRMNKEASQNLAGDITATWADFKVYMSLEQRAGTMLEPIDNGGNVYDAGMWTYSQMVTPDGTTSADTFDLHMLGAHSGSVGAWNSVGLIRSYGESRATVQQGPNVPSTASDDPLVNVFDYGTTVDEVIDDLEGHNDFPPYDLDEYPGDDTNGPKPAVVQDTTLRDGAATMAGFNAMCGLLEFETKSPIANDVFSVLVELAPGNYRGVKADVI
uniref:Uncharacterized protein n=1 Tax=uncultured marine virus TaxID=186617 RepID=S4TEM5_9VIRU|nr:hypothetical protein [uncultured marine virus]